MQMRIIGNVWLCGRAYALGDTVDIPEKDAERLAVLGVAEPAVTSQPSVEPERTAQPAQSEAVVESKAKRKRGKR